jgi:hypothetical protein
LLPRDHKATRHDSIFFFFFFCFSSLAGAGAPAREAELGIAPLLRLDITNSLRGWQQHNHSPLQAPQKKKKKKKITEKKKKHKSQIKYVHKSLEIIVIATSKSRSCHHLIAHIKSYFFEARQ